MEYLFECSTRYLMSECTEQVTWFPYLQTTMDYFVYHIEILIMMFLMILRRFPTTFQKISKDSSKIVWRPHISISNIFQTFPKIAKDFWRLPKIAEDFQGRFDHTPANLIIVLGSNMRSVRSLIASLVRIWKIRYSSPRGSFV